jgi:hypothetical protein
MQNRLLLYFLTICISIICSNTINSQTFNTEGVYDLQITAGTTLTIDADGAHGGDRTFTSNPGGSGGDITATFNVNTGDYIRVIVGGAGSGAINDGGGGGGTAVINCGNSLTNCDNDLGTLLVVAGAGGGAGINSNGGGAVTTAGDGSDGSGGAQGNNSATQASCNIYSGVGSPPGDGYGHGGAGFNKNGGGGAGYTGGDSGTGQNGGSGGSNFVDGSATSSTNNPGATGGGTSADGVVVLSNATTNLISSKTCAESLPVEMSHFDAVLINQNVQLNWITESEIDNAGFEVQWVEEGNYSTVREWKTIGFVSGRGTIFDKQFYSFNHYDPKKGQNYYRLKQVDLDGEYEYSNIVNVRFEGGKQQLTINPNPVQNGQITVTLPETDFETAEFMLYNAQGQMIQIQRITDFSTVIKTNNLPKGTYTVMVEVNGNRLLERLVIQ